MVAEEDEEMAKKGEMDAGNDVPHDSHLSTCAIDDVHAQELRSRLAETIQNEVSCTCLISHF